MPAENVISKFRALAGSHFFPKDEEDQNAWPAHGEVITDADPVPVSVYIRSIGDSGRDRPDERRFQNPAAQNQRRIVAPEVGYALLLGLWTELGDDKAVIVALDAYRRLGRETRFSLFLPLSLLLAARKGGFEKHTSTSGETIFAFTPERLDEYVEILAREQKAAGIAPFPPEPLWRRYREWNFAIAKEFFSKGSRDTLVFLDMDDDVLARIGSNIEPTNTDLRGALTEAVRGTLDLARQHGSIFSGHRRIVYKWRRANMADPPPCLGLLALFVSVAESMASDERFAGHNYYGRLASRLDLIEPDEIQVLGRDFRADSTLFWDALNTWLEEAEGRFGLPTAFAFDRRRFVSIPISQALVRLADRVRIHHCFQNFGLRPGQRIAASDMQRVLSDWLPDSDVSTSLKALWRNKDARDRISEIATLELEAWDGAIEDDNDPTVSERNLLLAISARTQPRPTFVFAFIVRESRSVHSGQYKLTDRSGASGKALPGDSVELAEALFGGYLRIIGDKLIDFSQALIADINLEPVSGRGATVGRRWKPIVVFRLDPQSSLYIETKRVEMAERHIVLCHQSTTLSVSQHLKNIASDYTQLEHAQNRSVPKNWTLFLNVRVSGICTVESDDLQSLVPVATTNIVLEGGLPLPSRNTWHARHPPTIHVATLTDNRCSLQLLRTQRLTDSDSEQGPEELEEFNQFATCDLSQRALLPGDYRLLVSEYRGQSQSLLASAAMRLRNSEYGRSVEPIWLGHDPNEHPPLWAINSIPIDPDQDHARLVSTRLLDWPSPNAVDLKDICPPTSLSGRKGKQERPPELVDFSYSDASTSAPACIERGHHIWILPPAEKYPPKYQTLPGSCQGCGLEKWFGGRPQNFRGRRKKAKQAYEVEAKVIKVDFSSSKHSVSSDTFFDAISQIRNANRRSIANIVDTISDDPWRTDEIVRCLSALAHIEVELDETLTGIGRWEVSAPTLNYVDDNLVFLTGLRTPHLLQRLRADASALESRIEVRQQSLGPSRIAVADLDESGITDLADSVADSTGHPVEVSIQPGYEIAKRLPKYSSLAEVLPLMPIPNLPCQRFNLDTLEWIAADKPEFSGAYRFKSWSWRYAFIDHRLLSSGRMRCGDYRVVKHLAALASGTPLVAYDAAHQTLTVPLGAELPWLYERAVVLESGLEPLKRADGKVEYVRVSRDVARLLWLALSQ